MCSSRGRASLQSSLILRKLTGSVDVGRCGQGHRILLLELQGHDLLCVHGLVARQDVLAGVCRLGIARVVGAVVRLRVAVLEINGEARRRSWRPNSSLGISHVRNRVLALRSHVEGLVVAGPRDRLLDGNVLRLYKI